MPTRTGKRSAHLKVQIVEDSATTITLFFNDDTLQPLRFTPADKVHFERLRGALDLHDPDTPPAN